METGMQGGMTTTAGMTSLVQSHTYCVLRVQDYARAKRFYTEMLGLQVQDAPQLPGNGFVATADGTGFQIYENRALPAPQNTACAFLVKDFDKTFAELKGRGVVFEEYDLPDMGIKTVNGVAMMGSTKAAWFKDTEGNIFNLVTDYMANM